MTAPAAPEGPWFDALARFLGPAYLRNAFTKGTVAEVDFLWTTCCTPRELELPAALAGVAVDGVHGVSPGRFDRRAPTLEHPELLLLGRRRDAGVSISRGGAVA